MRFKGQIKGYGGATLLQRNDVLRLVLASQQLLQTQGELTQH